MALDRAVWDCNRYGDWIGQSGLVHIIIQEYIISSRSSSSIVLKYQNTIKWKTNNDIIQPPRFILYFSHFNDCIWQHMASGKILINFIRFKIKLIYY